MSASNTARVELTLVCRMRVAALVPFGGAYLPFLSSARVDVLI